MTLSQLRQKHPRLIYRDFEVKPDGKNLLIEFDFLLEPDIRFRPKVSIPLPPYQSRSNLDTLRLDLITFKNLVFNLGMIEAISYWKAACPAEFVVKAGYLSPDQIAWWHDLFLHGLGEFFYRNQIDFTAPNFLTIQSDKQRSNLCSLQRLDLYESEGDLILVGGGIDSVVSLETLKKLPGRKTALMVNPGPNSINIAKIAGYKNPIIVKRTIDPRLLHLNKLGYLNGHTPFSAYLAFLGVLIAKIFGYKNILSSNELSAGQASLIYKSMEINHQYSKSYRFEKLFREYSAKYLDRGINYFSFLRPLYELQIAKIFASFSPVISSEERSDESRDPIDSSTPLRSARNDVGAGSFDGACPERSRRAQDDKDLIYDKIFVSCNVGRGKFWCGRCPKCAFAYLSLFPFLPESRLKRIFGRDLFADPQIQKHILDLVGLGQNKPFDCVGTTEESILAVGLAVQKLRLTRAPIPAFLQSIIARHPDPDRRSGEGSRRDSSAFGLRMTTFDGVKFRKLHQKIMGNWSNQNFLPPKHAQTLSNTINTYNTFPRPRQNIDKNLT